MSTVVPCIKGKFGELDYYQTKMKASDLVLIARIASEQDSWASMGIEERMQREINIKRVENEIAPYLVKNSDRFFGSIIIVINSAKDIEFESLNDFNVNLPRAYRSGCETMGFLTIDGGELIILDGQNRFKAIEMVQKKIVVGEFSEDVLDDEISVIFIKTDNNKVTRKIFNKINRTAKSTSRSDNLITSEDDGYAIVTRRLLDDECPLGIKNKSKKDIVNWKNNSLSARSIQLTTLSALNEITKIILKGKGFELQEDERPSDETLDSAYQIVSEYWELILNNVEAYKKAIEVFSETSDSDGSKNIITRYREDKSSTYNLLFKPAAQMAIFKGLIAAEKLGADLKESILKLNKINWSMNYEYWENIIVKPSGSIDPTKTAIEKASQLIMYLVAGNKMSSDQVKEVENIYINSKGRHFNGRFPDPIN